MLSVQYIFSNSVFEQNSLSCERCNCQAHPLEFEEAWSNLMQDCCPPLQLPPYAAKFSLEAEICCVLAHNTDHHWLLPPRSIMIIGRWCIQPAKPLLEYCQATPIEKQSKKLTCLPVIRGIIVICFSTKVHCNIVPLLLPLIDRTTGDGQRQAHTAWVLQLS